MCIFDNSCIMLSMYTPMLKYTDGTGIDLFREYYRYLSEQNEVMNLTAITDESKVVTLHFLDSLIGARYIPDGASVLDIGSGAGFPGVPLAIIRSDIRVTLLDSVNKKVCFLDRLTKKLSLTNTVSVHSRIEDYPERRFDVVTARAVASMNILAEYMLPFVRVGGIAIAYKSADSDEELKSALDAVRLLGGAVEKVDKYKLEDEYGRALIIIRKVAPSPAWYPRKMNKARISPL